MTQFYDLDAANARLPELREILGALRDQRAELIRLRDVVLERQEAVEAGAGRAGDAPLDAEAEAELKLIRLRMQGVIDQMQAGVARIDAQGITLREIETGLIDFPALVSGRQVCLCWRLGEDDVEWWHEMTAGFTGRKPLIDLA